MPDDGEAARMDLEADAWHQNEEGVYYLDCPECGSAATLPNLIAHGRCNGFLDDRESDTELDEAAMTCTAKLSLELGYTADPDTGGSEDAVREDGDSDG